MGIWDHEIEGETSPRKATKQQRDLACIVHKSLEICEQLQAQAAEFSGYAGKFRCFLERRVLKQFVLIHLFLKQALKQAQCLFKSYLARNKRVDAYGA